MPMNSEEERKYIEQCVLTAQEAILEGGFDMNPTLDEYSNRLVELEKRMKVRLNAAQFERFKEMRKNLNVFPWPTKEKTQ